MEPPLSPSRAYLTAFIAVSVPFAFVPRGQPHPVLPPLTRGGGGLHGKGLLLFVCVCFSVLCELLGGGGPPSEMVWADWIDVAWFASPHPHAAGAHLPQKSTAPKRRRRKVRWEL